jgi:hypothetical protein
MKSFSQPVMAGLLGLTLLLLGSCSWLLGDSTPSYMGFVEADLDVEGWLLSKYDIGIRNPLFAKGYDAAGRNLLALSTKDGRTRLLLLEGTDLAVVADLDTTTSSLELGYDFGVDLLGRLVSGSNGRSCAILPATGALSTTAIPPSSLANQVYYCSSATSNYRVTVVGGSSLNVESFDSAWGTPGTSVTYPVTDLLTDPWQVEAFGMAGLSPLVLLTHRSRGARQVLAWPTLDGADRPMISVVAQASGLLANAAWSTGEILNSGYEAWLCPDGFVAKSNGGVGEFLTHYGFDGSGSSISIGNSKSSSFSFNPGTSSWFIFDGVHGRFLKARKWW